MNALNHWVLEKWDREDVRLVQVGENIELTTGPGVDGAMLWLKEILPEPFTFEFEFTPKTEAGFFLLFFNQTGLKGEDILSDGQLEDRVHDTLFKKYTLGRNGYHISFRRGNEANCNLRKNAGQVLLKQHLLDCVLPQDQTVKARLTKAGAHIHFEIDGRTFMDFTDPENPYRGGRIGFRQVYASTAHYGNLRLLGPA